MVRRCQNRKALSSAPFVSAVQPVYNSSLQKFIIYMSIGDYTVFDKCIQVNISAVNFFRSSIKTRSCIIFCLICGWIEEVLRYQSEGI